MNTVHPRIMYTPPHGGVAEGGFPPLRGPGGLSPRLGGLRGKSMGVQGRSPRRKNFLVNVYCNFIVNMDHSL
jgi:hypothetical protein